MAISCRVTTMLIAGRRCGKVTCQNWRSRPAPSIAAASCRSRGTSWMAARKMTKASPRSHQIDAIDTPISAQSAEVSQGIAAMPIMPRYWLTRPNWVSSSQTQTSPITVAETTLGVKNRVRARVASGQRWWTNSANSRPSDGDARDDDQRVAQRVEEGVGDPFVGQRLLEVGEADPGRRSPTMPHSVNAR